ncbi:hypothetical protein ACFL3V_02545 [Nanoarchaeota archaeon]
MKKLLFILIFTVLCAALVAADSKLEIDRVEIGTDGRTLLTTGSNSGSFDVDPGDTLYVEVRLENNFDDDTDNDIEDVRVWAFIEDIDDDKDDVDDSDRVDVRADGHRIVKLKLKIPDDVSSYQDYELDITATGTDQNGTKHSDSVSYDIEIDRKENELIFEELRVSDVMCDGDAEFNVEIQNIGEEEELDVEMKVISSSLGTVYSDTFDLESINDDSDADSIYRKSKRLDLDDLFPGTHTLRVQVLYDNDRNKLEQSITLHVEDCESESIPVKKVEEERVYKTTERYSNPNRDRSFLFGDESQEVELQMPPAGVHTPTLAVPDTEGDDGFSTFVLLLACVAIIVFIILLLQNVYNR